MGKKYIIEINDEDRVVNGHIRIPFELSVEGLPGKVGFSYTIENKLIPYTEPDLDAIKQEEYEKGYKTAKVQCDIQTEKDLREVGERHYQKGLSDAWEAARKICANWCISDDDLALIFGKGKTIDDIMREFTAPEAIEKLKAYEQENEERDGLRQNIQTIVDQCGYTLDEIAEVLREMRGE